jgi:ABC-type phosphate transport system auxiliary subunit
MYGLYADKKTHEVIKEGITAHIRMEKATQKGRYDRLDAEIYRAIKKVEELNEERSQRKVNVSALESRLEQLRVYSKGN